MDKFIQIESYFQSIIDAIPYDLIIVNSADEVVAKNIHASTNLFREFRNLNNLKFTELISQFAQKYIVTDVNEFVSKCLVLKNKNFVKETLNVKISILGKFRYLEITSNPIVNAKQGFVGRVWQFQNTTDKEETSQEKTDFLSIVAHQLRTPLTGILGYTEMILTNDFGNIPQFLRKPLKAIKDSGLEMSLLIKKLLNLAKIEKQDENIEIKVINLEKIIHEVFEELFNKSEEKQIKLIYKFKMTRVFMCDELLIKEILLNLVDNAIKYSKNLSKVVVSIIDKPEGLVIKVKDTGYGIPENQQNKIFQKFFRAKNVLEIQAEGNGVGLYFVKNAVEKLQGNISFISVPNKGTTFKIVFPK